MNKLHKLYMVEGLPGIGKTTYAAQLKEKLTDEGRNVVLYQEGDLHPADMAWCSYLAIDEYEEFLHNVFSIWDNDSSISKDELVDQIQSQTVFEDGHAIVAYTKLVFPNEKYHCLYEDLAAREIYDGRLPLHKFTHLLEKRWHNFCKKALNTTNTVYIFECAFLQNHIFELMGFYDLSEEDINSHLFSLLDTVLPLNPELIYLEPDDLNSLIDATESCRPPENGLNGWMNDMIHYVEKTNYGKLHGLRGRDGVVEFLANRYQLDQSFIETAKDKDCGLTINKITRNF